MAPHHNYRIHFCPETDSTNAEARRLLVSGENGHRLIVWADYQHNGRGQTGNHWESEAGKNLLFTLCFQPAALQARDQFLLSAAASLAVYQALSSILPGFCVKWPNDIYHGNRKICGMLIEHTLASTRIAQSLIGIGINVNQKTFHSDAPNPVSLYQLTGRETSRTELLEQVITHFGHYCDMLRQDGGEALLRTYREHLFRSTGTHAYRDKDGEFQACVTDVMADGHLVLLDDSGRTRRYMFKEVEHILPSP